MNQFDWSISHAYVINIYISREISIEHPSVGLASLIQLQVTEKPFTSIMKKGDVGMAKHYSTKYGNKL